MFLAVLIALHFAALIALIIWDPADKRGQAMTTRTLAVCPDCGAHYFWQTDDAATFRCSCVDNDDALLAVADIYLEHDETWTTDEAGRLVIEQTDDPDDD